MDDSSACKTVTITLRGDQRSCACHPGETLLEAARRMGLSPRFACLSGECAACMARLIQGTARMEVSEGLNEAEIAAGYVLSCQAIPTSAHVTAVFEQ